MPVGQCLFITLLVHHHASCTLLHSPFLSHQGPGVSAYGNMPFTSQWLSGYLSREGDVADLDIHNIGTAKVLLGKKLLAFWFLVLPDIKMDPLGDTEYAHNMMQHDLPFPTPHVVNSRCIAVVLQQRCSHWQKVTELRYLYAESFSIQYDLVMVAEDWIQTATMKKNGFGER